MHSFKGELPEGRHMKVHNKNFYFDIGQNNRGIYMRISEVRVFVVFFLLFFFSNFQIKSLIRNFYNFYFQNPGKR